MKTLRKQFHQLYRGFLPALLVLLAFDYALCFIYELRYADGGYIGEPIGKGPAYVDSLRLGIYGFIVALLCLQRFRTTHPGADFAYLRWLRTTPWTLNRPAPFGPILPCWADLLVLITFVAFYAYGPVVHLAWVPIVFIGCYVVMEWLHLPASGDELSVVGVSLLVILAWRAIGHPWAILGLALVGLVLVRRGLRHCFDHFHELPLRFEEEKQHRALIFQGPDAQPRLEIDDDIGKSHKLLHADKIEPNMGCGVCIVLTLFVGFLGYALSKVAIEEHKLNWISGYTIFFVFFVVLIRWAAYMGKAPISLRGRWRTGKWIIPAYDRMFIAPAVIGICAIATWFGLHAVAAPIQWTAAATVAITMLLATGLGPSRGVHFLTGAQHYQLSKSAMGNIACNFEQGGDTRKSGRQKSA